VRFERKPHVGDARTESVVIPRLKKVDPAFATQIDNTMLLGEPTGPGAGR